MFQAKLADAQKKYDATVTRLNNLSGTANEFDLALAQANQALALEQLEAARRAYTDLKDGPDPVALNLARARLALAEANLEAARAEPTAEQLAVAQRQVESAQAALEVVQAQVDKLVILSPSAGLVLARSVEPGEVIFTGAQLITLARMGDLTITVYVPEDRYGAITLGQQAVLTADSFPGEAFTAIVVDIADQAEFTPRNVQTAEGRSTTVYAIKLAIDDPTGKLKPGMPADVSFIS
jgi:HlyD family secretion protein